MIKLSVVIITFNEEQNIARCIESVLPVADEILIVDSYSKDETKVICNDYKVRFVENAFEGHIQQKNYAASIAEFDHVLSLDADEELTKELQLSVLDVKSDFKADGYIVNRLSSYCGQWIKYCGWYPDKKLRLWNRRKGKWGGENPHDKYLMEEGSKIEKLQGDLLHYTFHTIEQHIETINKFSSIAAQMRFDKGKSTNLFKILFKPGAKFFTQYILKLGFLDGYLGYVICKSSAHSAFLKEAKLKQLYKGKLRKKH